ncbi:MAG TPA: hypothetical protein PLL75_04330 [Candidatus Omnitrophota bacterium]|nr:hypothetical protein [Candidatus Omnitrophota bacterium]HPS36937.1 hypothetical protein [Candidatus Omnitrophota bacterium]
MEHKLKTAAVACAVLSLALFSVGAVKAPWPGLPPITQSDAYKEFLKQPPSNLAKGICILNYFRNTPVVVQYDGIEYPALIAYPIGLAYLLTHYHDEDPATWIKRNCYRTLVQKNIIYLKFPDGSYSAARDVFLEKLDELEKAIPTKS